MKSISILILSIFYVSTVCAQSSSVKSKLIDGKSGTAISGATILLKHPDSSLAKMAVSDNEGEWMLENIEPGNYFLQISALGYEDYRTPRVILRSGQTLILDPQPLIQNAKVMKGVVISARRPLIERKADKLVMNVESSLTTAGSSALEVLEKAPGVTVDKDGNISLQGKDGVMVLIDDRPAYLKGAELVNYLRNMPASSLDQVEIMTNPSSKYDAAGNAGIINIKSKKIRKNGLNGSVNASAMVTDVARANSSLNLNFRKGKINLFGTYSYSLFNNHSKQNILRNFRDGESKEIVSIFDQVGDNDYHAENNDLKLGLDFYASKKTITGIVISGFHNSRVQQFHNTTILRNGMEQEDSSLISYNRTKGYSDNFSANVNLRHTFDSTGKKMTVDLDYIVYDVNSNMNFGTDYYLPDGSMQKPPAFLRARTPSLIHIYSAKTDFTFPLKGAGTIEAGLKSSYVTTDNDAVYENKVDEQFEMDNTKSNHFLYDENINAAYLSWNKQWKKWSAQAGIRAEHTLAKGHQLGNEVVPDSAFIKEYLSLFPTFYVSYQVSEKNSFGLNYGRRIERPVYQDLNPFLYFLDEYTYEAGNVLLQPEFTNKFELTHSYENLLHSSISYAHTNNAMTEVLKQYTEKRITYQTKENIADKRTVTFNSSSNFSMGDRLKASVNATLVNEQYKGSLGNGELDVNSWFFIGKVNEAIKLGKGWDAEVSGFYRSRGRDGQLIFDPQWRADAAIQKSILKNKGSINFFVRDIFNTQKFRGYVQYEDIDLSIYNDRVNRVFGISFKYRFGKPLKNVKQYNSNSASEEQRRVKSE